jgi:hypothetical protein
VILYSKSIEDAASAYACAVTLTGTDFPSATSIASKSTSSHAVVGLSNSATSCPSTDTVKLISAP